MAMKGRFAFSKHAPRPDVSTLLGRRRKQSGIVPQLLSLNLSRRRVVVEEAVKNGLDRALDAIRTAVAQFVVLVGGLDHGDAGLLAHLVVGYHAGIGLEHRIFGAERQDLELAV